jgi:hypothetical protein
VCQSVEGEPELHGAYNPRNARAQKGSNLLGATTVIPTSYLGCGIFGLGCGSRAPFPRLIVPINQFTFVLGPALLGWARDWWGSYAVALVLCIVCQAASLLLVHVRGEW